MQTKEKLFLKWIGIWTFAILAVYLATNTVLYFTLDNQLEIHISDSNKQYKKKDIEIQTDVADVLSIASTHHTDSEIIVTIQPTKEPEETIKTTLSVMNKKNAEVIHYTEIKIDKDGLLTDMSTENFSHYHIREFCMSLLTIAYTILLFAGYSKSKNELGFSYHSIFCIGSGIWLAIMAALLSIGFALNWPMVSIYGTLSGAPMLFAILTFPAVLLFSIFLTVSNISLICHEGFRFQNVLGILLSFVMVFGFIAIILIDNMFGYGTEFVMDIVNSVIGILYSIYTILECFLIGSVICCYKAGTNQPTYDKDYIVILGCMIAPDGTLYPLIRQRVDKAIEFYKNQLQETGKKAIFIPSGGKGNDEPIPEGLAMKNYLVEQGIEPEQILVEDQSVNTKENMLFSKKLMKENPNAVFSTTNYHVFRSGIISREAGIEIDGMGAKTKWYFWPNANVREVIGMLSYKWKSLVLLLIPVVAFITTIHFIF